MQKIEFNNVNPYAVLVVLLFFICASLRAQADELITANKIIDNVEAVPEGLHATSKLFMKMVDKRGKVRERETINYRKYFGEEKRTVLFYTSPNNVKGTGFLTYDYPSVETDDDQWLYLPALRKVRRISASDRGDYFLGTDFTYEDIKQSGKVDKRDYNFSLLGEDVLDGVASYRLSAVPKNEKIAKELGYGKLSIWVDKSNWVILKIDYWDKKGKSLKTYTAAEIVKIEGVWTRQVMEVKNHITGHHSRFEFKDVDYSTPVNNKKFAVQALNRGS